MASTLTLKDLLGTILSDVVRAQHESNMRTSRLSERYAADGSMAGMQMPSAMIAGGVFFPSEKMSVHVRIR